MNRPYRDNEILQVQTVRKKVNDFRDEMLKGYLGEAEKILVDVECEFAFLTELVDDFDEEQAREMDDEGDV